MTSSQSVPFGPVRFSRLSEWPKGGAGSLDCPSTLLQPMPWGSRLRGVDQRNPEYWVRPPWWRPFEPVKAGNNWDVHFDEFLMHSAHSEALNQDRGFNAETPAHQGSHPKVVTINPGPDTDFYPQALEDMSEKEHYQVVPAAKKPHKRLKPRCYHENMKHAYNAARDLSRCKNGRPAVEVVISYHPEEHGWWIWPEAHPKNFMAERGKFYDGVYTHPSPYHQEEAPMPWWDITIRQEHTGEIISKLVRNFSGIAAEITALRSCRGELIDTVMVDADWAFDEHIQGKHSASDGTEDLEDPRVLIDKRLEACEELGIDYKSLQSHLEEEHKPFAAALAGALDRQ